MTERRPDRVFGPGHDEFWHHCAAGELRLQRCAACRAWAWPVVEACERCGGAVLPFERCSGSGRIVSWATFERDYYQGMLPIPWDTILVELDEGPLFVANPAGFTWRETVVGMPVRVNFIDAEDRRGRFRLPVFERN